MLARIQVVRPRPLPWRGKTIKLRLPPGATRPVPSIRVLLPRPGPGRLPAWRWTRQLGKATFGLPPPPPTLILALTMAAKRQIDLTMANGKTLFLSMISTNTLNLVMHGS